MKFINVFARLISNFREWMMLKSMKSSFIH